jgi:hypothetical protein
MVYFFFPDVIDGYATERQEFIVTSICITIAWLQWSLIFLGGIHIFREYNENLAAERAAANRRPALPSDGSGESARDRCTQPGVSGGGR